MKLQFAIMLENDGALNCAEYNCTATREAFTCRFERASWGALVVLTVCVCVKLSCMYLTFSPLLFLSFVVVKCWRVTR